MATIKRVVESAGMASHLESLLGEIVTLWCMNYIYSGKLAAIDGESVLLENALIVYETGELSSTGFKDAQSFDVSSWYVKLQSIESFGVMK